MSASRNPYVDDDSGPKLKPSVVAFIDILGYRELVNSAANREESQQILDRLHASLLSGHAHVDPNRKDDIRRDIHKKDLSAFRAFTDNIVIGYPISSDGEIELGQIFYDLSYFQTRLTLDGFFVRGAIAVGDLYIDDIAVFGAGLVDAYEAESKLARDPRIVLATSAKEAVRHHIGYYDVPTEAPQNDYLLEDSDGQYFLHYLSSLVDENGHVHQAEFGKHKQCVEAQLALFKSKPPIWSKYLWAANYHNYFCQKTKGVDSSMLISTSDFMLTPARISRD